MSGVSLQQMAEQVALLMEQRLKARGQGLHQKLRRSGRLLPRHIRREAEFLARSCEQARAPKLFVQLDHERVARAYDTCLHYLRPLGAAARRRRYLADLAARLGLVIMATAALVIGVLVWRGFL